MTLIVKMYFIYMVAFMMYVIYKEIELFRKGNYEPNPFKIRKIKPYNKHFFLWALPLALGPGFLLKELNDWLIFVGIVFVYLVVIVCNANVLSLLVFRKTKENKILKDVFMFDALVAVCMVLMWKYLPRI